MSTRGRAPEIGFSEALLQGLAQDGGLYLPTAFDRCDPRTLERELPLAPFASAWLRGFLDEGDPLVGELDDMCEEAFDFPIPTVELSAEGPSVLELFHGPTAAFKDVGARFLAAAMSRLRKGKRQTVLVATSGDTGGAVAGAFVGREGVDVLVLFPEGKISRRQEMQLTGWGRNVRAFAVDGTFDDCQSIVKAAFAAESFRPLGLVSANSINLGRLVPQTMYYARASSEHFRRTGRKATFIVPTGNLGNAVAAVMAKKRGAPIEQVVLATNENRTLADAFSTGRYDPRPSVATLANAMDVGNPSNYERLTALFPDRQELVRVVSVTSATDSDIREAIAVVFREYGYVACPHTAAAFHAALELGAVPLRDRVVVATAHPAKFETIVEPIIGRAIDVPATLRALFDAEKRVIRIGKTLQDFERAVFRSP